MDGDEQVGLVLVGDGSPRLQRDESIVVAGVDHVGAQPSLQQSTEAQRHVQHHILFHHAIGADGAGVVAAVSGVNHDAADLQAECARQAAVASRSGRSFVSRRHRWRLEAFVVFLVLGTGSHGYRSRRGRGLGRRLQLRTAGVARTGEQAGQAALRSRQP